MEPLVSVAATHAACVQFDPNKHKRLKHALRHAAVTPKVTDFGMAMRFKHGQSHQSNVKHGTPFYVAPEVRSQQRIGTASDTYGFGIIMWELMHGCNIFVAGCARPPSRPWLAGLEDR